MEPGSTRADHRALCSQANGPPTGGPSARAAFTGMSLDTTPIEITRAALESVALRFRQIYEIMAARLGEPAEVIASGGALAHSPAWTQMMADALQRPVSLPGTGSVEPRRGAAGARKAGCIGAHPRPAGPDGPRLSAARRDSGGIRQDVQRWWICTRR